LKGTGCRSKGVARKRVRYSLFSKGRKRLRIYLNQDKEQDVQEWKEKVADLSECHGKGIQ
jgi:hypothetical protein